MLAALQLRQPRQLQSECKRLFVASPSTLLAPGSPYVLLLLGLWSFLSDLFQPIQLLFVWRVYIVLLWHSQTLLCSA